jgi:hypothetical protein
LKHFPGIALEELLVFLKNGTKNSFTGEIFPRYFQKIKISLRDFPGVRSFRGERIS